MLPLVNQTRQAIADDVFADALQRALEATERFRVASQDRVSIWLINRGTSPQGVPPSESLPELAQALQLSYLLMPTVKDLRGTLVLELLLLAPAQPQTPVATASAILPPRFWYSALLSHRHRFGKRCRRHHQRRRHLSSQHLHLQQWPRKLRRKRPQ